jgi:hypothetical protein
MISLAEVKYLLFLQSTIVIGKGVEKSGVIKDTPFIIWTGQANYPRRSESKEYEWNINSGF